MTLTPADFQAPPRLHAAARALLAVGAVTLLVGLPLAPRETWANVLLVSFYVLGLGLAGAAFVALHYVTGAGWGVALRRVPEAMTAAIPVGAAGVLAVAVFGSQDLYPWVNLTPEAAHEAANSPFRQAWLTWPFFLVRTVAYCVGWTVLAWAIVRTSRRQDGDGDVAHTFANVRRSAGFLVFFAVSLWLASYDWFMSLEAPWSSTVFGVYHFAGLFQSGLAAIILGVIALRRAGPFRGVLSGDHLHDLGKLLFAFSIFWMYTWFCQYMLVWYTNVPEETGYYVRRLEGVWQPLLFLNLALNWLVPFLVLLPRSTKRDAGVLARVCVAVLCGRWLDLYLMTLPSLAAPVWVSGLLEAGLAAGAAGAFLLAFLRALGGASLVPVNEPYLVESLHTVRAG
jgi:hypothetical protein